MNKIVCIGMVVALCAAVGWAEPMLDGVISEGEWSNIVVDPSDDNGPASVEITRWGSQVSGGYLYWFCEIAQNYSDFQGYTYRSKEIFLGLWIDADSSDNTYLSDGYFSNCADNKGEWAINHRGIDVNLELGLAGEWVNGSLTGPEGEGPDGSMYNYWGAYDDASSVEDKITDGSWFSVGHVLEARVLLSELDATLRGMADGVVLDNEFKVAVGVQGSDHAAITWGYDVGTPILVPEPITVSLLGAGAVILLKRKIK